MQWITRQNRSDRSDLSPGFIFIFIFIFFAILQRLMTTRNDNTLETPIMLVKWPWFCSEGEGQGSILLVLFCKTPSTFHFRTFFFSISGILEFLFDDQRPR
ncbi:hypothetical protein J3458_000561 [Metarhizium acridum]|uniref:uncharacterized protein n=1 Tax=Metarhizium acridum TaxID=92637 RepID=UPI001C6AFFC3|nr:hypothetical protein J3458_000561 [Metarhizium acridum]